MWLWWNFDWWRGNFNSNMYYLMKWVDLIKMSGWRFQCNICPVNNKRDELAIRRKGSIPWKLLDHRACRIRHVIFLFDSACFFFFNLSRKMCKERLSFYLLLPKYVIKAASVMVMFVYLSEVRGVIFIQIRPGSLDPTKFIRIF
jgi:hypothetical protein